MKEMIAVYPISADPPTLGHADLLQRMSARFDKIFWVAAKNSDKKLFFDMSDRIAMMQDYIDYLKLKNIVLDSFMGSIIRYATQKKASFLIRGIRNTTDFQYEYNLASVNRNISPVIETLCVFADPKLSMISSSVVRELALLSEKFEDYVVPKVAIRIKNIIQSRSSRNR